MPEGSLRNQALLARLRERQMSGWNDSEKWESYLSPEGCPVCNQTPETRPKTEVTIAELSTTRLVADRNTCLKGHCCLVLKPHAIEIYELADADLLSFLHDAKLTASALKRVTDAVKLNYEIHGNSIPHLHMHLWPRHIGDIFEGGPIDFRNKTTETYGDGEFEAFVRAMRTALRC
jgi:diadenosine tetraphosphate (Ap4A) HIT family hydrolase